MDYKDARERVVKRKAASTVFEFENYVYMVTIL